MKYKKIIFISVIIISMVIIGGVCLAKTGSFLQKPKEIVNDKSLNGEDNNIYSKKILDEIYSFIPFFIYTFGTYNDAYSGDKVIAEDIKPLITYSLITQEIGENILTKNENNEEVLGLLKSQGLDWAIVFPKETVISFLKERYNKDESLLISTDYFKVIALGKKYNRVPIEFNAIKDKNDIIIKEKIVFVEENDDKCYVYSSTKTADMNKPLKIYDNVNIKEVRSFVQNDLIGKVKTFQHTFKSGADGYYWYSTELL